MLNECEAKRIVVRDPAVSSVQVSASCDFRARARSRLLTYTFQWAVLLVSRRSKNAVCEKLHERGVSLCQRQWLRNTLCDVVRPRLQPIERRHELVAHRIEDEEDV